MTMTANPYFLPHTIAGEPRRPIVERVEACRPKIDTPDERYSVSLMFTDGLWRWTMATGMRWPSTEHDAIALRLTRLAVIEWLQANLDTRGLLIRLAARIGDKKASDLFGFLMANLTCGADDAAYNNLAHELADATGVGK